MPASSPRCRSWERQDPVSSRQKKSWVKVHEDGLVWEVRTNQSFRKFGMETKRLLHEKTDGLFGMPEKRTSKKKFQEECEDTL